MLHGVQNCLAQVVTHSPLVVAFAFWSPQPFTIVFKICSVTYKVLCNSQPIYLKPPSRTRDLRSSDQNVFCVPRIKTKMDEGSFSVAAPKLWNRLPCEIRV